jgi:hypothetical protein
MTPYMSGIIYPPSRCGRHLAGQPPFTGINSNTCNKRGMRRPWMLCRCSSIHGRQRHLYVTLGIGSNDLTMIQGTMLSRIGRRTCRGQRSTQHVSQTKQRHGCSDRCESGQKLYRPGSISRGLQPGRSIPGLCDGPVLQQYGRMEDQLWCLLRVGGLFYNELPCWNLIPTLATMGYLRTWVTVMIGRASPWYGSEIQRAIGGIERWADQSIPSRPLWLIASEGGHIPRA